MSFYTFQNFGNGGVGDKQDNLTGFQLPEMFVCKMVSLGSKFYAREFVMHG